MQGLTRGVMYAADDLHSGARGASFPPLSLLVDPITLILSPRSRSASLVCVLQSRLAIIPHICLTFFINRVYSTTTYADVAPALVWFEWEDEEGR